MVGTARDILVPKALVSFGQRLKRDVIFKKNCGALGTRMRLMGTLPRSNVRGVFFFCFI